MALVSRYATSFILRNSLSLITILHFENTIEQSPLFVNCDALVSMSKPGKKIVIFMFGESFLSDPRKKNCPGVRMP